MKRLMACAAVILLACGGNDGPAGPAEETGTIRILNTASIPLAEVNISRCDLPVWGANRIDSPILPGGSRDFTLAANCYDVRVAGSPGGEVLFFDLILAGGQVLPLTIFDN